MRDHARAARPVASVYDRVRKILESARTSVARSVNTTQVIANWLVGREIIEEEQRGHARAAYGSRLLADLSRRLQAEFGNGYSVDNLEMFRQFYREYSALISVAPRRISVTTPISDAPRRISKTKSRNAGWPVCPHVMSNERWCPGQLHPNLSWTHYRTLLRVDGTDARAFYEIEAIRNNWSARELERQINSLLFERLALSKDKKGLLRLAVKGHEPQRPSDIFKDPVVMEFLGLPESPRLVETDLEQAMIGNLQSFLLEMGRGFAFVARQERLTLDGDHFYIDLVFYHTVLKCYVIIDLKTGKLTHQDLGQLQLYVNYYDRERRTPGDNPTLGLILCADKNDAVVRYTLAADQQKTIFASRYKLHLPTEAELRAELRREVRTFSAPATTRSVQGLAGRRQRT
jgi:predicted nuclease of restriction endonuclease-like (RecB) superfamily